MRTNMSQEEKKRLARIAQQASYWRLFRYIGIASTTITVSLLIGMFGYHNLENLNWVDSFMNAAMLLGGMGPVTEMHSSSGKIFAGIYALYSGIVFIVGTGLVFAPLAQRLLSKFKMDEDELDEIDELTK